MKFRLIEEEKSHHSLSLLARVLGVSRAGYHAWRKRPASERARMDEALKALIEEIHAATDGTYGAPRIHEELAQAHDVHVGAKRVARLLRELGLQGVSRRGKHRPRLSAPESLPAPDLVRRSFTADRPNELWLADITYVPTWEGWLFLAAVIDMCSRAVCGWSMRDDLKADLVVDALGMAATRRRPKPGLVHHSDRGGQYRSLLLGRTLRESGIVASMGSPGDAYDNAPTESFMATIKTELIHRRTFKTRNEARLAVFRYIEGFYNPQRRHSSLGYLSPLEFERMLGQGKETALAV
jgi:putative transposase